MSMFQQAVNSAKVVSYDEGLRKYMLAVYNYMSIALLISAISAMGFVYSGLLMAVINTPLMLVIMFAPLGVSLYMGFKVNNMSFQAARNTMFLYSFLMGLSLSSILLVFSGSEIFRAFFITSAMFLSMSIYGYTTKKDLTSFGSFLVMGMFGLLIAILVNMFTKSNGFSLIVSFLAVLIFTGLTAYNTQEIKKYYRLAPSNEVAAKYGIMGALQLYMNFIAIFIHLLNILRSTRD
jgi:FtsH-binding integral membrane protein